MGDSWTELTEADKARMAEQMSRHWTVVEELREKKATDAKRTQADIDAELEEIGRIARIVNANGETKDQLSLFVGEEQSKAALAEVAARRPDCSPINSRSCPVHGECSCERLEDEAEGEAPAVKSVDCVLHGVNAPHATEPKEEPAELTEPQIVEALAREAVEEWERLGKTPESVTQRNARVKEAVAARSIPTHRRKPFAEAVKRLLSDVPSVPAGAGAVPAPAEEADGNVAEEASA